MLVTTRTRAKWYRASRMGRRPCAVCDSAMACSRRCMRPAIDEIDMLPDQRCRQCAACFRCEVEFTEVVARQAGEDGCD